MADQKINLYLGVGALAARPVSPNPPTGGTQYYYANDTSQFFVWDPTGGGSVGAWDTLPSGVALTAIAALTPAADKIIRYTSGSAADLLDFHDEDDMSSDDATGLASQQSIKAFYLVPIGVAVSDETTDITTGTAKATFRMPFAMTLTEVRANVNDAPTGSTIEVDINEGGVSVLSTVISIDASEESSETAATPPVISDSALADDAEITIDIDQVGSTNAGKGLKVWLIGTRA